MRALSYWAHLAYLVQEQAVANLSTQSVTDVRHWNDSLFSFKTTRDRSLKFENGHFLMLGIEVEGKPLMRAYSIASPNYDEELEFLSIKVADGALTSRLQNIQVGGRSLREQQTHWHFGGRPSSRGETSTSSAPAPAWLRSSVSFKTLRSTRSSIT